MLVDQRRFGNLFRSSLGAWGSGILARWAGRARSRIGCR